MNKLLLFVLLSLTTILPTRGVMAALPDSCGEIDQSFTQNFTMKVNHTSLVQAVRDAISDNRTPKEVICASLAMADITSADIIRALKMTAADPVEIRLAAKEAGFDLNEVDSILAPKPKQPSLLPVLTGEPLGPGKASPSVP